MKARRFSEIASPESAVSFPSQEEAQKVADEIGGTVIPMHNPSHRYIVNGEDKLIEGYPYFVVRLAWMYFNGFYNPPTEALS